MVDGGRGWILTALLFTSAVRAEGSRTLYPASYPTSGGTCANAANRGCRANLDLQPGNYYVGKVNRRTFLYVYARAGEYVLLGSSNRSDGGDILVYAPTDFGTPGMRPCPRWPHSPAHPRPFLPVATAARGGAPS